VYSTLASMLETRGYIVPVMSAPTPSLPVILSLVTSSPLLQVP
jgi:hypothetical protein